jgi:tetratricopeptide (TPR) repeat protein
MLQHAGRVYSKELRACYGIHRRLGQHEKAIDDYSRGEAMDPKRWEEDAIGLLMQADIYARQGDEASALACCARLPGDFWTPGLAGAPAGDKARIADEVRRMAAEARQKRV